MTLTIDPKELSKILVEILTDDREKVRGISGAVGQAFYNARISLCEQLVVFLSKSIKEESIDMAKLKLEFKKETVALSELLGQRGGGSAIEAKIAEVAKTLEPGQAKPVEMGTINWGHFSSRVYDMVDKGDLTEDFGPIQRRGENGATLLYLARYTKEQQAKRPKRRSKKVTA